MRRLRLRICGRRRRERPLAQTVGAEEIEQRSGDGDARGDRQFFHGVDAVDEEKSETCHGKERRQRIERHAEGARKIGALDAQQNHADLLQEELQQNARDDKQGDDLREREETEEGAHKAESHERTVGNAVLGVDPRRDSGSSCRRRLRRRAPASSRAAARRRWRRRSRR